MIGGSGGGEERGCTETWTARINIIRVGGGKKYRD